MTAAKHLTEYIPDQIWLKEYPVRFGGCRFNARMSVIRLSDRRLMIHSPCPIDQTTKQEIEALGSVAVIVAPGNYHPLNIGSAQEAFPQAEVQLCPGTEKRDPALSGSKIIGDEPDPVWSADFDHVLIRGSRFIQEIAFFHRATATLILVDVIENIGDNTPDVGGLLKFWWWLFRMWNRPKPAPEYQLGWNDKAAAREDMEKILAWEFTRIIISHGDLIETNGHQVARDAWQSVLQTSSAESSGYSRAQRKKLLKDFDRTCALMQETLCLQYGDDKAWGLQASVLEEYKLLLPEVPRLSGFRARMLNRFLLITAQELAAYKGLRKLDIPVDEIWQLCHKAIRLRANAIPKWKRWLMKQLMFSTPIKKVMARRASLNEIGRLGDFKIEYLDANHQNFDLGVNYRGCGNYNFVVQHGGLEFAPYVCMSDIALSEAFGWGLVRTQTLADGCDHCDFRMKKDGPTRISSKTLAVQRLVELISEQESHSSPVIQGGVKNA